MPELLILVSLTLRQGHFANANLTELRVRNFAPEVEAEKLEIQRMRKFYVRKISFI